VGSSHRGRPLIFLRLLAALSIGGFAAVVIAMAERGTNDRTPNRSVELMAGGGQEAGQGRAAAPAQVLSTSGNQSWLHGGSHDFSFAQNPPVAAKAEETVVEPTPTPQPTPRPRATAVPARAPTPPPATGTPASDHLARIRQCESGGNYSAVSPDGRYRGGYQFDAQTWVSVGGSGDPALASPAEQDYRAQLLYSQRGGQPWPVCQYH
jgi:hypothetical protein